MMHGQKKHKKRRFSSRSNRLFRNVGT